MAGLFERVAAQHAAGSDADATIRPRFLMTPARSGPQQRRVSSDNAGKLLEQQRILLRRHSAAFGLSSILLLATLIWTTYSGIRPSPETSSDAEHLLRTGIDPNTARWFELAQLPGIGETLARRMEDFRGRSRSQGEPTEPVFRAPADLAQVKGIGEKTVRRIGPFLRFPDPGALR